MNISMEKVCEIFRDRIPGADAEYSFFSVLVPLIEKDGRLYLLYEVRGSRLDRQPGEICFPGGALEDGETIEECAVRETCEELGIEAGDIDVIAQLDTVYTYNNFAMYCFLGVMDEEVLDRINVNSIEVEETFLVPLSYLIENPPRVYTTHVKPVVSDDFPYDVVNGGRPYNWRGGRGIVPVYEPYNGHVIWGLTARITKKLVEIIRERMG
ncbi:MAG: CoA pyrophosphatase [Firmicutes bacterium]|nr:CoA pyrophosphatase [Bacillota bacterium]MDY4959058.1 CoA pyrophosphatase [Lentihominibacter sp.]